MLPTCLKFVSILKNWFFETSLCKPIFKMSHFERIKSRPSAIFKKCYSWQHCTNHLRKKSKMTIPNGNAKIIEDELNDLSHILYLPVDRPDYSKYYSCTKHPVENSLQSRVYMFLEHPASWCGLIYHMTV